MSLAQRYIAHTLTAVALVVISPLAQPVPAVAVGSDDTLIGSSAQRQNGENYRQAVGRVRSKFGGLDVVRIFNPGLPQSWSSISAAVGQTPVVVSFKMSPESVLSGKHDARLRQWFTDAPRTRPTYWIYFHEPENDSVNKVKYRQAWTRISRLADRANNGQLKSTLNLMCWTLSSGSGRNWRDYYPGPGVIDVLGFDCYNTGRRNGIYRDPADILDRVVTVSRNEGKPFGIAELGSPKVWSDGGTSGRAAWLREYASELRKNDAEFGTYWDARGSLDFRLQDQPSVGAWKEAIAR